MVGNANPLYKCKWRSLPKSGEPGRCDKHRWNGVLRLELEHAEPVSDGAECAGYMVQHVLLSCGRQPDAVDGPEPGGAGAGDGLDVAGNLPCDVCHLFAIYAAGAGSDR